MSNIYLGKPVFLICVSALGTGGGFRGRPLCCLCWGSLLRRQGAALEGRWCHEQTVPSLGNLESRVWGRTRFRHVCPCGHGAGQETGRDWRGGVNRGHTRCAGWELLSVCVSRAGGRGECDLVLRHSTSLEELKGGIPYQHCPKCWQEQNGISTGVYLSALSSKRGLNLQLCVEFYPSG